ncbi:MAG: hypothetical protein VX438_05940, partial [Planctomycetota bacterium]|nr:hypothetical protein [Planctomycetota bacterium]
VDELTFNNVFAVGLREIQELASLDHTAAAEHLYKLTSGFDRVSLVDVIRQVEEKREILWSSDPENHSVILDLLQKQKSLSAEVESLSSKACRWTKLASRSSEMEQELGELGHQLHEDEKEARLLELAMQVRDRWNARRLVDEQIESYGVLPNAKHLSVDKLDDVKRRIAKQKIRVGNIQKQRRDIADQAKALPVNRLLWAKASRIEALQEHSPWVASLQRKIEEVKAAVSDLDQQVGRQVEEIRLQLKKENANEIPELSPEVLETFRDPARQLKAVRLRVADLEKECESGKLELSEAEKALEAELERCGCQNLGESLDVSGRMVKGLRRRAQLEEKLTKLLKDRKRLEGDLDAVVREQLLPTEKLVLVGAFCVIGVFLAVGGIFLKPEFLGGYPEVVGILLGGVSLAVAFVMRSQYNQVAKEALDDCQSQLGLLKTHIRRAKEEREKIDLELPDEITRGHSGLVDVEDEFTKLEEIVPLENQVKTLRQTLGQSKETLANAEEELLEQQRRWKLKLRSIELPENFPPLQVKQLLDRSVRLAELESAKRSHAIELSRLQADLGSLSERIRTLMLEVELEPVSEDPLQRLAQLGDALTQQGTLIERRKALRIEYLGLKKQIDRRLRFRDRLRKARQGLFGKVDVDNEADYRELVQSHQKVDSLQGKRASLSREI